MSPEPPPDDPASIWERAQAELRSSLPRSSFELWVTPLRPLAIRDATLYISAPEKVRPWLERRYSEPVADAVKRQAPSLTGVVFVTPEATKVDESASWPRSLPLERGQTFDRFVIGPGNRFAHLAALAVAELPGEAYNPLFLHGPPGLGKSHLLGAIAHYLRTHHRELVCHYTTAERFTEEFVSALRRFGPDAFKRRYRELDALLIDDVQVLEGKERTQEEFVHTFNALYGAGKQIVLSSDRPPEALSHLAERLRDRFQWGLSVELAPPDLRTRVALLLQIASEAGLEVREPAALREIASAVVGNVRQLEGAMTRVVAFSSLLSEPLTIPLARKALSPSPTAETTPRAAAAEQAPSVELIQEAVCSTLGLSRQELLSPSRSSRIVVARQLAMYLSRELTPLSLPRIARCFGRDHTTVLHAVRAVQARLEPGSETAAAIHRVQEALGRSAVRDHVIHDRGNDPQA